jgi:hypothetical protein
MWVAGDSYNGNRAVAIDLDLGIVEIVSATSQAPSFVAKRRPCRATDVMSPS